MFYWAQKDKIIIRKNMFAIKLNVKALWIIVLLNLQLLEVCWALQVSNTSTTNRSVSRVKWPNDFSVTRQQSMVGNIADNLINFDIRNKIKDKICHATISDFEIDIDWVYKIIYDIYVIINSKLYIINVSFKIFS